MRITSSRRKALTATATLSLVAASAAGIALASPANAAAVAMTLSSVSGPSAGGNSLTATTATNVFYTGAAVEFVYKATSSTACPVTYTTPSSTIVAASTVKVLSTKKLAFTVPAGVTITPASPATSASWLTCVYSGAVAASSPVTGTAPYTVAAAPTIAALNALIPGVTPTSGPALGGGSITITGTGFTGTTTASTTTAKIGSVPLTDVKWVNATTLTGTVPAQAAANNLSVSVTNTGGTATLASAYSYTNGITISPNTAPTATAVTDVDVQGVGFSTKDFTTTTGSTGDNDKAHVYLVDGAYDPTGTKDEPQIGECLNVLVISDTELICTVNTNDADGAGALVAAGDGVIADGTYTLTVVSNGEADVQTGGANVDVNYTQSIVSSGSTFTVAPY